MRVAQVPPFAVGKAEHYKNTDFGTEAGARKIAGWIMQAWHACGHPEVQAWIEREPVSYKSSRSERILQHAWWTVKTNLVNGLPFGLSDS